MYFYIYAKRNKDLLYSASLMPFFSLPSAVTLSLFFIQITLKAYLAKKKKERKKININLSLYVGRNSVTEKQGGPGSICLHAPAEIQLSGD